MKVGTTIVTYGPMNLASGTPYDITINTPPDPTNRYEEPQRVHVRLWGLRYRQSSAGAPTFTGTALPTHTHDSLSSDGTDATPAAHQHITGTTLLVGVDTAGQAGVTVSTSAVSAGTPSGTISAPGAAVSLDTAPNANLDITIDGTAWKSDLGDGTERLLVDEACEALRRLGTHTMRISCGANAAVLLQIVFTT